LGDYIPGRALLRMPGSSYHEISGAGGLLYRYDA
jgi:hypothetical protein